MSYFQVFQLFENMESLEERDRQLGIVGFPNFRPLPTSKLFIFKRPLPSNDFTLTRVPFSSCPNLTPLNGGIMKCEIILLRVRWYLAYPLSYQLVAEMVNEPGEYVHLKTVFR